MHIKKQNTLGFTLIELLVVIAIISLLSSIVYASVSSARQKASVAKASAQGREIKTNAALAQETLLAGTSIASIYTNTNPNIGLSSKPELAKKIFPQYESLSSTPLGASELTAALPKVPVLVSGTTEDTEYVYVSNGGIACTTQDLRFGATPNDNTFSNNRCAPIRCGTSGEAAESVVMYRLGVSNLDVDENTPGYNSDKVVQMYYTSTDEEPNWGNLYGNKLVIVNGQFKQDLFIMMCS